MRILVITTALAGLAGAACLWVAAQSPAYVSRNGTLVEPFAWMVSGRILLVLFVAGILASIATGLVLYLRRLV